MSKLERVTFTVPTELADRMRASVEAGEFVDISEIVHEALEKWAEREDVRAAKLERLKMLIAEGDEGPFRDGEEFFDELLADLNTEVDAIKDAA